MQRQTNSKLRLATYLALITAVISGTNNFLTKIAVTAIHDPILYTSLKNGIVAVLIIGAMVLIKKLPEVLALTRRQVARLLAIGLVGGAVPFALYFTGLQQTSAINAGLIHKTLFLWVLLIAIPVLKEKLRWQQWAGIGAIFVANIFVGGFSGFHYNTGELMILGATVLWAIENVIAKKTLEDISSVIVAGARMTFGALFLIVFIIWRGAPLAAVLDLGAVQWGWTILTSVLLFGYVTLWYTALKHAPATYVATLLVPATLVTNVLSAIFVTGTLATPQIASAILLIAGTVVMIAFAKRTAQSIPQPSFSNTLQS